MSKRLIGYGYTNANGVATLDYDAEGNELQSSGYVGQGVGNVDISASAVIDGSTFVSGTYPVIDGVFYDGGVNGNVNLNWNNKWNNSSNGEYMAKRTTTNDYTTLTNNIDDTPTQSYYTPRNANNQILSFDNAIIEWENFASPKTNSYRIAYFRNSSSGTTTEVSLNGDGLLTVNCHIKITVIDGVVKIYKDGTLFSTTNFSSGQGITGTQFGFQINESTEATTIKYKDFVIYPI